MNQLELALAALLTVALFTAAIAAPWLRFVLTIALAKAIAVMGGLLLLRAGQVSFGHALYLAFGAYTVAFLAPHISKALALLGLAALGSGLVGLIVGLFLSRYRQIFCGMLNLARCMCSIRCSRSSTTSPVAATASGWRSCRLAAGRRIASPMHGRFFFSLLR